MGFALIVVYCCENMKNITVSLDDATYRRARVEAARRDTSVSALVKGFLIELAQHEPEEVRLKNQERKLREQIVFFSASDRMTREDTHDRSA
jgi:hypothetical protein